MIVILAGIFDHSVFGWFSTKTRDVVHSVHFISAAHPTQALDPRESSNRSRFCMRRIMAWLIPIGMNAKDWRQG